MHSIASCLVLIVTVVGVAVAKVDAQQAPSTVGQNLQPDADSDEAAVNRVIDQIMHPYLTPETAHGWRP